MKELMDILSPVLGDELAAAIIEHRKAKASGARFDAYRASITLNMFLKSPDPKLAAWEYINRNANRECLTVEYLRRCFSYCRTSGVLRRKLWSADQAAGSEMGTPNAAGYLVASVAGKNYLIHRLAWFHVHGAWPDQIDHIDRVPSNNRLENLRACSNQENNWNISRKSVNKSGFTGVSWDRAKRKWLASIRINGKTKYLGRFEMIEDAQRAYAAAVEKHRGYFLRRTA